MAVVERETEWPAEAAWDVVAGVREIEIWRRKVSAAVSGLGDDAAAVEVARLGVTELPSNVCKHVADRRCRLEVRRHGGAGLLIRLFDHSKRVPAVTVPDWDAESGRGLWLLREAARDLGYTCTPDGKWVWFTVPLVR